LGGRTQNKVRNAKEFIFKNGFETQYQAAKLLSTATLRFEKAANTNVTPAPIVAVLVKPDTSSFRPYYKKNFQANALCNQAMDWLYKQMIPCASPAAQSDTTSRNESGASFQGYYKKHFQANSVSNGVMDALYKQMVPSGPRALPNEPCNTGSAPFQQYYKHNFQGNSLCKGVMDSLYEQMVPAAKPRPQSETALSTDGSSSFQQYYQNNFQKNSLCKGSMDALYRQMGTSTVSAEESNKQIVIEATAKPEQIDLLASTTELATYHEVRRDQSNFKMKPSVGSWRLRPRIKPPCCAAAAAAASKSKQAVEADSLCAKKAVLCVLKPSVGTWYAPRRAANSFA